jgi:UDP-N-acetylmuramyl pentapeptide phosphotransferase/UDP-N-acetylglucosamine-1-phosphate transferase
MSHTIKLLLMWTLSPLGTLLNTGLLVVALLVWGADPARPGFWLAVGIFLGVSGWLDVRAYLTQRRKGLTSFEVAEAVYERLWRPRRPEGRT